MDLGGFLQIGSAFIEGRTRGPSISLPLGLQVVFQGGEQTLFITQYGLTNVGADEGVGFVQVWMFV